MNFTHYLITRFNVPVENWNRDKQGQPVLDDAWMEHRLLLFQRFCVPSIAGQTEKNFRWIIYCDINSDAESVGLISRLVRPIERATIRFVSDFNHLLTDLKLLILESNEGFVITSRVDNDDGLGKNYIHDVQKHFIRKDNTIINLNGGVLYDEEQKILTEIRTGRNNHYGSLIEEIKPIDNLVSIMGYPHDKPPAGYTMINVNHRFSWLKIIHSRNLSSGAHGLPISMNKILPHFNIQAKDFVISQSNTWKYVGNKLIDKLRKTISPS